LKANIRCWSSELKIVKSVTSEFPVLEGDGVEFGPTSEVEEVRWEAKEAKNEVADINKSGRECSAPD
jgi:hypothetical protein